MTRLLTQQAEPVRIHEASNSPHNAVQTRRQETQATTLRNNKPYNDEIIRLRRRLRLDSLEPGGLPWPKTI
jgi:hypothetical protein